MLAVSYIPGSSPQPTRSSIVNQKGKPASEASNNHQFSILQTEAINQEGKNSVRMKT